IFTTCPKYGGLTVLETKLLPYLIEITDDEKLALPKIKDRSMPFVIKASDYGVQKPSLVPSYVDVAEMKMDIDAVNTLKKIYNPLAQILKAIDDTMTVAGSEAYISALTLYNSIKSASKLNVTGEKEIYDDLSARFQTNTKKASASVTSVN
ncbi:MAG: hypothetical protein H7329_03000, partial [Opitutaceae bacterium]|nr:hypothetical protein [Cytophagales bacterium]